MLPLPEMDFKRTPVTLIIAAVAAALEIACTFSPDQRLDYYRTLGILPLIWVGQLWRPFTSSLLHGGLLHAGFNIYWLLRFGSVLERRFGSYRILGLIVLLGYVSMLPQFIVTNYNQLPVIPIVGLSGIVYGLFGVLLVGRRRWRELDAVCDANTVQLLLAWLVFCIFLTHFGVLPVANVAHGGGLLFGGLYGLAAFDADRRLRWTVLASVATLLVLSTLIACPGHAGYEAAKQLRHGRAADASSTAPTTGRHCGPLTADRSIP